MFIYAITNDVNEKVYVGLHTGRDLRTRWTTHCSFAKKGSRSVLALSMRKHGTEKFHITSLWSGFVSYETLCTLERYFIRSFNSRIPNGYNMTAGGDGTFGYRHTSEEKVRRAERMRQQIATGIISNKGKKRPAEIGRKISAKRKGKKGKPMSEENRRKLLLANKGNKYAAGVKLSPEAIARLREARKKAGYKFSPEFIRQFSLLWKGKKHSEETKQKMSLSQRAWWSKLSPELRAARGKKSSDTKRLKRENLPSTTSKIL